MGTRKNSGKGFSALFLVFLLPVSVVDHGKRDDDHEDDDDDDEDEHEHDDEDDDDDDGDEALCPESASTSI